MVEGDAARWRQRRGHADLAADLQWQRERGFRDGSAICRRAQWQWLRTGTERREASRLQRSVQARRDRGTAQEDTMSGESVATLRHELRRRQLPLDVQSKFFRLC